MNSRAIRLITHVVTYGHEKTIETCLESLLAQNFEGANVEHSVWVTDNKSPDHSARIIQEKFSSRVELKQNQENKGFSHAHNKAFNKALEIEADYVLIANPDLTLEPSAAKILLESLAGNTKAGMACPKLLRADEDLVPENPPRIDAAGMYITPELRHFDRGSEEEDRGQYDKAEYVFGASGALILFKAEFLRDIAYRFSGGKEVLDESFFAYREDADLSWRAQVLGWSTLYLPQAVGYHRRFVLPERRAALPPEINALGVQNRFLLQLKHSIPLRCLISGTWRNLLVLLALPVIEWTSIPALFRVLKEIPQTQKKYRELEKRRRVPHWQLARWFSRAPRSEVVLSSTPDEPLNTICILIVNYNSGSRLSTAIEALASETSSQKNLQIVVADNASDDGSLARVKRRFGKYEFLSLLSFENNQGFAGAIEEVVDQFPADAYLILNPDVCISQSDVISLAQIAEQHDNLVALAPVLEKTLEEKNNCRQIRNLPTVSSTIAELLGLGRLFTNNPATAELFRRNDRFLKHYFTETKEHSGPFENPEQPILVEQPAAACLLLKTKALKEIGGFDTSFWPAWYEDVDLSMRLKQADYCLGRDKGSKSDS